MKSNGLYHGNSHHGSTNKVLFHFGSLLLVGAVLYLVYLYYPLGNALTNYWLAEIGFSKRLSVEEQIRKVDIKPGEFYINVPKIMASAKIIPNVSAFDQKEYLRILGDNIVAQAKGSNFPGNGLGSMMYVFAHSTQQGVGMLRKNAVFYLLGQLNKSDLIAINYNGKIYRYQVYDRKIVGAKETEYLEYRDPNKEILILQTCWPIGTDWNRLLIFGELVK